jgi:putative flavoprotein involved in K+ transport
VNAHPAVREVVVIGAGPAGLAAAAVLQRGGATVTVLERADALAASWRTHYDRLHLHTVRSLSGLPGMPIPREYGRWVARDDLVSYFAKYAAHNHLDIRTGAAVARIDRAEPWLVRTAAGEEFPADAVVVATGYNNTPSSPDWPGRDTYTGDLIHAKEYRNPAPFRGRDVLVVGAGNTGAEIAVDLAEGGATRVRLAIRTPPHIVRRNQGPIAAQYTGLMARRMPAGLVNGLGRIVARGVPDLSEYGLPRPEVGLYTRVLRDRHVPLQDVGLVAAVQARRVEPVAAVTAFQGDKVELADGALIQPDLVIAATGYRSGLTDMVGHLGVLDDNEIPTVHSGRPAAPGLYFLGYTISLGGALRDIAIEARLIGEDVSGRG